jgi:hypothetical protein
MTDIAHSFRGRSTTYDGQKSRPACIHLECRRQSVRKAGGGTIYRSRRPDNRDTQSAELSTLFYFKCCKP